MQGLRAFRGVGAGRVLRVRPVLRVSAGREAAEGGSAAFCAAVALYGGAGVTHF